MKKLCALLLCVLLVSVVAFSAFAAGETTVKVAASATDVKRGAEVTVTVSVAGDNAYTSMGYIPFFNSEYFTVTAGESKVTGAFLAGFDTTDGLAAAWTAAGAYAGDFLVLNLKVKDDAPFGTFKVTDVASFANNGTPVAFVIDEPTFTVVCDHNFGAWANKDAENHERTCSICGAPETEAHAFAPKTDAEKHWEECACGAKKDEAAHTFAPKTNAEKHWEECACGEKKGEAAHTFAPKKDNDKHWEECACGEKKGEAAHTFAPKKSDSQHWEECACGQTKNVEDHRYEDWGKNTEKHWLLCACGKKTDEVDHFFQTKKDADKHWEECACGEKKGEAAHTYANFTKVDENQHKGVCACTAEKNFDHAWDNGTETLKPSCVAKGEMTFTCECSATKTEPINEIPHELENLTVSGDKHSGHCTECDQDVVEEHKYTEAKFDAEKHWEECLCGEKQNEAEHAFGTALNSDENGHWYACACGAKKDEAAHTLTYKVEGDKHFQVCECGFETAKAAHEYAADGKCACGAEKPAEPTEPKPTEPKDPVKDPAQPDGGDMSFATLLVVLMVLSACGMAVTVIARKKIVR